MAKKRKKNKKQKQSVQPEAQQQPRENESAPIFQGVVEDVEVKPPNRFVFLVLLFFVALLGAFYYVATSEKAAAFLNLPASDPPPTVRQKVQENLKQVMRLRAESKYDEAYTLLHEAHEKYPEEPNLNRELGWHHVEKGLFVFAAEYFELAAEKIPNNSKLNFYRGELHHRWGERVDSEASRPLIDENKKHRLIDEAREHFEKSRNFLSQSLSGKYVYNKSASEKKLRLATDGWHRMRLKKGRLTFIRAKGTFSSNQVLLQETLDDLERLKGEVDLSTQMRRQTEALIRDIMKER